MRLLTHDRDKLFRPSCLGRSCGTSISLNWLAPEGTRCQIEYASMALISNLMWQFEGLRVNNMGRLYHMAFARIAAAADLKPGSRADIPLSFTIFNASSFVQTDELYYNNRMLPPEETLACYEKAWDKAAEFVRGGCKDEKSGLPQCPIPEGLLLPFLDARIPLKCSDV